MRRDESREIPRVIHRNFRNLIDRVQDKIDEKTSSKSYDDIFGESTNKQEGSSLDHCISELTWDDLTFYYFEAKGQLPEICSCIIYIEDISRINVKAKYRMEQFFKNASGDLLLADEEAQQAYGRVVFAEDIDKKLKQQLTDKTEIYFEI